MVRGAEPGICRNAADDNFFRRCSPLTQLAAHSFVSNDEVVNFRLDPDRLSLVVRYDIDDARGCQTLALCNHSHLARSDLRRDDDVRLELTNPVEDFTTAITKSPRGRCLLMPPGNAPLKESLPERRRVTDHCPVRPNIKRTKEQAAFCERVNQMHLCLRRTPLQFFRNCARRSHVA